MKHANPHDEIADHDVAELCQQLLNEGTPANAVVSALLMHAALVAKFGGVCPQKAQAAFANLINSPAYIASRPPHYRKSTEH